MCSLTSDENRERSKQRSNRMKHKRKKKDNFTRYIYRVMKEENPNVSISSDAMVIVNNFVLDLFERISREASHLLTVSGKSTLTSREIDAAVRLLLPGQIRTLAVVEGIKALNKYQSSYAVQEKE